MRLLERYVADERVADDLVHGQVVIIAARWIFVLAGLLLAMWNPASLTELRIEIFVLLCLAVVNFYLHLHLLVKRLSAPVVVYAASAVDLAIVTLLVAIQGGYPSNLFIFYYPAMLGFAVAFPRPLTVLYTGAAVLAYGTIGLATAGSPAAMQDLVVRLLMLIAVAACGMVYLRIETDRRDRGTSEGRSVRRQGVAMRVASASESEISEW